MNAIKKRSFFSAAFPALKIRRQRHFRLNPLNYYHFFQSYATVSGKDFRFIFPDVRDAADMRLTNPDIPSRAKQTKGNLASLGFFQTGMTARYGPYILFAYYPNIAR